MLERVFLDYGIKFGDRLGLLFFYACLPILALSVLVWINNLVFRPKRTFGSEYSRFGLAKIWVFSSLALLILALAYAQPYTEKPVTKYKKGIVELVIIVDSSFSMYSKDTGSPRLEIAVREILNLWNKGVFKEGDKASLFTLARGSRLKVGLTGSLDRFVTEVTRINVPEKLAGKGESLWGTQVSTGLKHVYEMLDEQDRFFSGNKPEWKPSRKRNRLVVFFSDGDLQLDKSALPTQDTQTDYQIFMDQINLVIPEYRARGLSVYCVGIGTGNGYRLTDIIKRYKKGTPEEVRVGSADYSEETEKELMTEGGQSIVTKLDVSTLKMISSLTGGKVAVIESRGQDAQDFLGNAINSHRANVLDKSVTSEKTELWPEFAKIVIALLLIGLIFY